MAEITRMECCGLREASGISHHREPKQALKHLIMDEINNQDEPEDWPYTTLKTGAVLFTQASPGTYGDRLADYIESEGLGKVHRVPQFLNHNTGNKITLFVWVIEDRDAIRTWFEQSLKRVKTKM
jgi:hypothetical protein